MANSGRPSPGAYFCTSSTWPGKSASGRKPQSCSPDQATDQGTVSPTIQGVSSDCPAMSPERCVMAKVARSRARPRPRSSPARSRRAAPGRRSRRAAVGSRLTMASARAVALGHAAGSRRPGRHHQRRAQHQEEVAGQRLGLGPRHRLLAAWPGRRRWSRSSPSRRSRGRRACSPAFRKGRLQLGQFVPHAAFQAGGVAGVAVQLDHLVRPARRSPGAGCRRSG